MLTVQCVLTCFVKCVLTWSPRVDPLQELGDSKSGMLRKHFLISQKFIKIIEVKLTCEVISTSKWKAFLKFFTSMPNGHWIKDFAIWKIYKLCQCREWPERALHVGLKIFAKRALCYFCWAFSFDFATFRVVFQHMQKECTQNFGYLCFRE